MDSKELARRLAQADRQIVALRKATLELKAAGRKILKQRNEQQTNNVDEWEDRVSESEPSGERAAKQRPELSPR